MELPVTTAFKLGELTARVKMAENAPTAGAPVNLPPTVPLRNKEAPLIPSATKYVPQQDFPIADRGLTGVAGQNMDKRTYKALLQKHYSGFSRPFGFKVPEDLAYEASKHLPAYLLLPHLGNERNSVDLSIASLRKNPAQQQSYENNLKHMQELAFKNRTSKPFYYDEHIKNVNPAVASTDGNDSGKAPVMVMSPTHGTARTSLPGEIAATKLHEHVHTTQGGSTYEDSRNRNIFEAELPAVLSENAHRAYAYHKATGQWPQGEMMGMPYSQLVADLQQKGHLPSEQTPIQDAPSRAQMLKRQIPNASTQMSTVMNDPAYRAQIQKMINDQHATFDQQDYLTGAANNMYQYPRQMMTPALMATAGTPINAPLNALANLIPSSRKEETKRDPYASKLNSYSSGAVPSKGYDKNQTTFSAVPQRKYDVSGKAIPRGPLISTTQRRYDADGKAIP
jgi:hypothetical protein